MKRCYHQRIERYIEGQLLPLPGCVFIVQTRLFMTLMSLMAYSIKSTTSDFLASTQRSVQVYSISEMHQTSKIKGKELDIHG